MRKLLLVLVLVVFSTTARCQDVSSGNFMLPQCKLSLGNPGVDYRPGVCFGMVLALTPTAAAAATVIMLGFKLHSSHPARLHETQVLKQYQ
jgi:hypothetical protein